MAVLAEALWMVRLLGGHVPGRRRYAIRRRPASPQESRELAVVMRRLPATYADRIGTRLRQKVTEAAAAGEWERAVDQLITGLRARSVPVTADERDELRSLLRALHMPGEAVDALAGRSPERAAGSPAPMPVT